MPRQARRAPRQGRARATVEAVLGAVARILRKGGVGALTTNRIAEVAGVSIGSVYQYFDDREAILAVLLDRHVDAMGSLVEETLAKHAEAPLELTIRALVDAMVEAHTLDPDLHELLFRVVPPRPGAKSDFAARLRTSLRAPLSRELTSGGDDEAIERALFLLAPMAESLAHAVALERPAGLSLAGAKDEAARALLAYVRDALTAGANLSADGAQARAPRSRRGSRDRRT